MQELSLQNFSSKESIMNFFNNDSNNSNNNCPNSTVFSTMPMHGVADRLAKVMAMVDLYNERLDKKEYVGLDFYEDLVEVLIESLEDQINIIRAMDSEVGYLKTSLQVVANMSDLRDLYNDTIDDMDTNEFIDLYVKTYGEEVKEQADMLADMFSALIIDETDDEDTLDEMFKAGLLGKEPVPVPELDEKLEELEKDGFVKVRESRTDFGSGYMVEIDAEEYKRRYGEDIKLAFEPAYTTEEEFKKLKNELGDDFKAIIHDRLKEVVLESIDNAIGKYCD